MNNQWFPERYSEIAINKFILQKAYQIIEEEFPLLQFYYSPPFSNPFYLQIILQKENLSIVKSTLKEVNGQKQVHVESGDLSGSLVLQLNRTIQELKVNSFGLKERILDGRDGYLAELTISRKFHSTTFSWSEVFMPSEWDTLTPLVEILLKISNSLVIEPKYCIEVELVLEEDNNSFITSNKKSMLIEYNRTRAFLKL